MGIASVICVPSVIVSPDLDVLTPYPAIPPAPECAGETVPRSLPVELPSVDPQTGSGVHQILDVHHELELR